MHALLMFSIFLLFHRCVAILQSDPDCQKTFIYPAKSKIVWRSYKKRRLELGLYQAQVGEILGVTECTVTNWEKNRSNSTLRCTPKTVEFLGYVPETKPAKTMGQKIVRYQKLHGINQETMAKQLGVDPGTLERWERDENRPDVELMKRVESLVQSLECRQTR